MSIIAERIESIKTTLPRGVELVAVSKYHPVEAIREAYEAGQRLFGESRVQEFVAKVAALPEDIRWHFIGHLQTNKVRQLLSTRRVALIEAVDSERLLRVIDAEAEKLGITAQVLMQLHVAAEETKYGMTPEELQAFFRNGGQETLKATHICGVMGMATNTEDRERIVSDFRAIATTFRRLRDDSSLGLRGFDTVSMGMSDDYREAIGEGSTLVRVGTAIFGEREYQKQ